MAKHNATLASGVLAILATLGPVVWRGLWLYRCTHFLLLLSLFAGVVALVVLYLMHRNMDSKILHRMLEDLQALQTGHPKGPAPGTPIIPDHSKKLVLAETIALISFLAGMLCLLVLALVTQ